MHAGTLLQSSQAALAALGESHILDQAYLAGGSALALHLGHRKSFDFDFFFPVPLSPENLARQLNDIGNFKVNQLEPPHTLIGTFNDVRLSLFHYDYPMIDALTSFQQVKVASVADIAAMKLTAISGRAARRDYVDLYSITQSMQFEQLFDWYEKKFGDLGNNLYVIIRALGYFEDAEGDEMPEMLTPLDWGTVKRFLSIESLRLAKKYLEP